MKHTRRNFSSLVQAATAASLSTILLASSAMANDTDPADEPLQKLAMGEKKTTADLTMPPGDTEGATSAPKESMTETPVKVSEITIADEAGTFEIFLRALKETGLDAELAKKENVTIFAPNDEAFAKLPETAVDDLFQPENRDQLKELLSYHVFPGTVLSADLNSETDLTSLAGPIIDITTGDQNLANDAVITTSGQFGENGTLHSIDAVIFPPSE